MVGLCHAVPALQRLASLFKSYGHGAYTIGEAMTITQHSAQAAKLAAEAGEREAVVVAALFHDVGHMLGFEAGLPAEMDGCGFEAHDASGGAFLTDLGFDADVGYLASQHVRAKRYLVAVDDAYADRLSAASRTTLGFQGGPMSAAEVASADADGRWSEVLRLRSYDEAAKDDYLYRNVTIEDVFDEHRNSIMSMLNPTDRYVLSTEQLRKWDKDGYLIARQPLPGLDLENMTAVLSPPDEFPMCLVHRELAGGAPQLCRVENFAKHEPRWRQLCLGVVQDLVSQVFREEAVLFKDKINFKGPQGAGFLLHQDATAYAGLVSTHVSALVAIDEATVANGALQIAPGRHRDGILPHTDGVVADDVAESMDFEHVLVRPGDVVLFDSFLPHKSDANATPEWRRSAYLTFNKASEGDHHATYYAKKQAVMQQGAISINLDFAGTIVD